MIDDSNEEQAVEALFDSAKRQPSEISPAFAARLEADIVTHIEATAVPIGLDAPPAVTSAWNWRQLFLPASSLVAATAAGVWIGFQAPNSPTVYGLFAETNAELGIAELLPAAGLDGFIDQEFEG